MRAFIVAGALSIVLSAGPVFAQAAAGQGQAQPKPQNPPAQTAPAPQPPRPFPEGAKIAFVDIQRIADESNEGKQSTAKVKALNDKKVAELQEKNKALQADRQKLEQGGGVLSDQARAELEKKIERQQVEIQRFQQDAQAEVQDLQRELQIAFQQRLMPVINQVATERGLHMLFSRADSGLVWADTGLDLTNEIIKRLDATTSSSGGTASSPAPKPPSQ